MKGERKVLVSKNDYAECPVRVAVEAIFFWNRRRRRRGGKRRLRRKRQQFIEFPVCGTIFKVQTGIL
jgi:hypothetical protein